MNKNFDAVVLATLLVVFLVGFIIGKLIVTIHHNQKPSPPKEYVLEQKAKGITFEF